MARHSPNQTKLVNFFTGKIWRALLGLSRDETSFTRRGFRGASENMRARLEQIGHTFVGGYHAALERGDSPELAPVLNNVGADFCGFAFEGAAMGLALLDCLTPWRRTRFQHFLAGPGQAHIYMAHVGAGWVWARMPVNFRRAQAKLDPLLGWLALDGWGFHEGFFHWPNYMSGQPQPQRLAGYEKRVFDQGLGRSFWFVNGGNVEIIARVISEFPAERQPDLWSGLGLGATYAGMAGEEELRRLRDRTGPHRPQLAQGAAFAAKARQRAGNSTDYTDLAARVFCEMPAADAARLTDAALENLPADSGVPAFEIWRRRIQNHFDSNLQLQETKIKK